MIQTIATLRAASTILRQAINDAETASPGEWEISQTERVIRCENTSIVADRSCADIGEDADLDYIAAMQPRTGRKLVEWFNGAVKHIEQDLPCCEQGAHRCTDYGLPALAVAHSILGEEFP